MNSSEEWWRSTSGTSAASDSVFKDFQLRPLRELPQAPEEWLIPKEAVLAVALLEALPVEGRSLLEVGVLNGAYMLNALRNVSGLRAVGIDPYPNLKGMRRTTMERLGNLAGSHYALFESFDDLLESDQPGPYSILRVDGLHEEAAVIEDMTRASQLMGPHSVIIIDDFLQPWFPGVNSGCLKSIDQLGLSPFLVTGSQLYACWPEAHRQWLATLTRSNLPGNSFEFSRYFGDGKPQAYKSMPTVGGWEVLLSPEHTRVGPNFSLVPDWPKQPAPLTHQQGDSGP